MFEKGLTFRLIRLGLVGNNVLFKKTPWSYIFSGSETGTVCLASGFCLVFFRKDASLLKSGVTM
jgi:hypothetical protein